IMPPPTYHSKVKLHQKYHIIGFISSGTYGRVFKARSRLPESSSNSSTATPVREFAIKKFKPDKDGASPQYTGISQSAIREIALCAELSHRNLIHLVELILDEKAIFM